MLAFHTNIILATFFSRIVGIWNINFYRILIKAIQKFVKTFGVQQRYQSHHRHLSRTASAAVSKFSLVHFESRCILFFHGTETHVISRSNQKRSNDVRLYYVYLAPHGARVLRGGGGGAVV